MELNENLKLKSKIGIFKCMRCLIKLWRCRKNQPTVKSKDKEPHLTLGAAHHLGPIFVILMSE